MVIGLCGQAVEQGFVSGIPSYDISHGAVLSLEFVHESPKLTLGNSFLLQEFRQGGVSFEYGRQLFRRHFGQVPVFRLDEKIKIGPLFPRMIAMGRVILPFSAHDASPGKSVSGRDFIVRIEMLFESQFGIRFDRARGFEMLDCGILQRKSRVRF